MWSDQLFLSFRFWSSSDAIVVSVVSAYNAFPDLIRTALTNFRAVGTRLVEITHATQLSVLSVAVAVVEEQDAVCISRPAEMR